MCNLIWQYHKVRQGLKQNRLYHINDGVDAQAFEDDIDDQGEFNGDASNINTANNYAAMALYNARLLRYASFENLVIYASKLKIFKTHKPRTRTFYPAIG